MRLFGIAFCLAGIPSLTLAVLAMIGRADVWPALLGVVLGVGAATVFVLIWRHDVDRLIAAVRRVALDAPTTVQAADGVTLMDTLALEIERLSRRLAASASMLEQYRRADSLILERLPDPVIVLAQ